MHKKKNVLSLAVQRGKIREATLLLRSGVSPNARDDSGWTPLHWACQEGYLSAVKLLIKHGARVDALDEAEFTPLRLAVGEGHSDIVRELLRRGAKVNRKSRADGNGTLLQLAAAWNRFKIARELVLGGANINAKDSAGRAPLFFAVMYGHLRFAKFLIKQGAIVDLNQRDSEEHKDLLDLAKEARNIKLTKLLQKSAQ